MSEPNPPLWRPPGQSDERNEIPADAQKVFDTVVGPNLRLLDNLIQLGSIVAGTALGVFGGSIYARSTGGDAGGAAILGGFAGLVLSLLLSGFVIGIVRTIMAAKSSTKTKDAAG